MTTMMRGIKMLVELYGDTVFVGLTILAALMVALILFAPI